MKRKLLLVVTVITLLVSTGISYGEAINVDLAGTTCEILNNDTIRLRYVNLPDAGIMAWGDLHWNGASMELVNSNYDTLSVVGDWIVSTDGGCNSSADTSYITLKSDHTISCTPRSLYDTNCKTTVIEAGNWTLSGDTLNIFVTDAETWTSVADSSKLTGTLNGGTNYNGIQDGKMYIKDSTTYDYTNLKGCWTATRVTQ
jgi:hypothetical protein